MPGNLGECPECGLVRKHTIACREPSRRRLAACKRDKSLIGSMSPASRCIIRGKLGRGCAHVRKSPPRPKERPTRVKPRPKPERGPFVVHRRDLRSANPPKPWISIALDKRDPSASSALRNPFDGRYGILSAQMYRTHLQRCIEDADPDVLAELAGLTEAHRILCPCKSKRCHGEVLADVWRAWSASRSGPG